LKSLSKGEIHAYWLETSATSKQRNKALEEEESLLSSFLSRREVEGIERAKDADTRRERILSRALLRSVLSSYLAGHDARDLVIAAEASGKPYLAEQDKLWMSGREAKGEREKGKETSTPPTTIHFNVTHSPTLIGVCVASTAVGLDVEQLGRSTKNDVMKIAQRRFSRQEILKLEQISPNESRVERFLQLWTLKEAFLKCTGSGISSPVGLKHCHFDVNMKDSVVKFDLDLDRSSSGSDSSQLLKAKQWEFCMYEPTPENTAAICWEKKEKATVIKAFVADSIEPFLESKAVLQEICPRASTQPRA
jgi:4'-phosphopantetheinyl transferase